MAIPLRYRVSVAFLSFASVTAFVAFDLSFLMSGYALPVVLLVVACAALIPGGCGEYVKLFACWVIFMATVAGVATWWSFLPRINPLERNVAFLLYLLVGAFTGLFLAAFYVTIRLAASRFRRWLNLPKESAT